MVLTELLLIIALDSVLFNKVQPFDQFWLRTLKETVVCYVLL